MTPKDKAEELAGKYNYYAEYEKDGNGRDRTSKLCALIAVNEIINAFALQTINHPHLQNVDYWREVKKEIQKL